MSSGMSSISQDAPSAWQNVELMGLPLASITEAQLVGHIATSLSQGQGGWLVTPNIDILRRWTRDRSFVELIEPATIMVADGMPLIWASRLMGDPLPERVAGSSVVTTLAKALESNGKKLVLMGGSPGAAEAARDALIAKFPNLQIPAVHCPPLGFEDDSEQMKLIEQTIDDHEADVVYVALGCPKQERLIATLAQTRPHIWWLGIGNSLSFLGGQVQRAPTWMQKTGLEWIHRLLQEPRRLMKRYLVEGLPFAAKLGFWALGQRFSGSRAKTTGKIDRSET